MNTNVTLRFLKTCSFLFSPVFFFRFISCLTFVCSVANSSVALCELNFNIIFYIFRHYYFMWWIYGIYSLREMLWDPVKKIGIHIQNMKSSNEGALLMTHLKVVWTVSSNTITYDIARLWKSHMLFLQPLLTHENNNDVWYLLANNYVPTYWNSSRLHFYDLGKLQLDQSWGY